MTLSVAAINVCWLLPIAAWVARGGLDGGVGLVLAYAPLLVFTGWLRAGRPEG